MKNFKLLSVEDLNKEFTTACGTGNLELVKYLLTSPELPYHPDINTNNDSALRWACINNEVRVIKYLLSSPELKKHANVHVGDDYPFKQAIVHDSQELFQFYIFDLNIPKTKYIKKYIKEDRCQVAKDMFNTRELNQKLENELLNGSNHIKKKTKFNI